MSYLENLGLITLATILFIVGCIIIWKSFRYNNKPILMGVLGVLCLLISGNIIIYIYSFMPVPRRIIKELYERELPELGLNVRCNHVEIKIENL